MKYIIITLISIGLLAGCSTSNETKNNDTAKQNEINKESNTDGLSIDDAGVTQEDESTDTARTEVNETVKEIATQASYEELNVNDPPVDKVVKITGTVESVTDKDSFIISQEEDGEKCLYLVMNMSYLTLTKGDKVSAYGPVQEGEETPVITGVLVERE
ncbi:hypothetical protein [Bacillus halotolerans]|uniref:hypothetical protein n=1 Tax=Bacillus halotolerans TaxID=260554 RepID=UPI00292EFF26|nr:hypothetical protein [Bacillus halotolerans]MEC0278815.1 hypothetical protein [Bacillus halotolerans]MEC1406608.1 hypothetical protein [Bacillus halotolerans]